MKKYVAALSILAFCLTLVACANVIADHQETIIDYDTSKMETIISEGEISSTDFSSFEASSSIYEIQSGNTTGNISNNAFVAMDDKNIYYLRQLVPDTELQTCELVKVNVSNDTETVIFSGYRLSYLNVVGEWIYFIGGEEGCIYRIHEDGSGINIVSGDLTNINAMVVVNEHIYCRAADSEQIKTLNSIDIETGEINNLCQMGRLCSGLLVNDGWIYYSVPENNEWKAYRIRTDGTENFAIGDLQLYSACIEADRIYYLDDNLQICSMCLDGTDKKLLTDDISAIRINVSDGWVYYSDTAAIHMVKVDGSEKTKICDFPSSNNIDINVLGECIYLRGDGFDNQRIKATENTFISNRTP